MLPCSMLPIGHFIILWAPIGCLSGRCTLDVLLSSQLSWDHSGWKLSLRPKITRNTVRNLYFNPQIQKYKCVDISLITARRPACSRLSCTRGSACSGRWTWTWAPWPPPGPACGQAWSWWRKCHSEKWTQILIRPREGMLGMAKYIRRGMLELEHHKSS